ncbi:hypothetical protein GDO86_006192, partial [Hymenochirus boettgeri]
IFNSRDYVENKATVFHATFLQANTQSKAKPVISIGQFILPPLCLQEEIKRKIGNFIWEQGRWHSLSQETINTEEQACSNGENHQKSLKPGKREDTLDADTETTEEKYYSLQNYPVNNMLTGYISVDEMKTFSGELHDFIPNTSDYSVFCIQDQSDFSKVRNILNKK